MFLRTKVNKEEQVEPSNAWFSLFFDYVDPVTSSGLNSEEAYAIASKTLAKIFSEAVQSHVVDVENVFAIIDNFDIKEVESTIISAIKKDDLTEKAIDEYVDNLFEAKPELKDFLNYFVRFETGNALLTHPSANGHKEMACQIWKAYTYKGK